MILFCCIFLCIVGYADGVDRADLMKNGPFKLALYSNSIKCEHNRILNLNVNGVKVHFYDFTKINAVHKRILSIKSFDSNKKFIIYVGGCKSQIEQPNQEGIQRKFKNSQNNYLIIPDHSQYTNNKDNEIKNYARSVKYVCHIGKALPQMLVRLHRSGVAAKNIHCNGHNLGGQILDQIGEEFLKTTGQNLVKISALDPAGPCFFNSPLKNQIRCH